MLNQFECVKLNLKLTNKSMKIAQTLWEVLIVRESLYHIKGPFWLIGWNQMAYKTI